MIRKDSIETPRFLEAPVMDSVMVNDQALMIGGIELVDNLPTFPGVYSRLKSNLLSFPANPKARTQVLLIDGDTGSGKRTLATQVAHLVKSDEELNVIKPELVYLGFADSGIASVLEGRVQGGHGRYDSAGYRAITTRLTGSFFEQMNNHENSRLVIVEVSASSMRQKEHDEKAASQGNDRGYSLELMMAQMLPDNVEAVALWRKGPVFEHLVSARTEIATATPKNIADILERARYEIHRRDGKPVSEWSDRAKRELIVNLNEGWAPAQGVIRSNTEQAKLMEELYQESVIPSSTDKQSFWEWRLTKDIGFGPDQVTVMENTWSGSVMSMHADLLDKISPIKREIAELKRQKKARK